MTVRVSKPEFNLREKITELDYDRVPFQKMPVGGIVQVISVHKGDYFTTNSTSFVDITGLTASITPKFPTSKILVQCSMGAAGTTQTNLDHGNVIKTMRRIGAGDFSDDNKLNGSADGNRIRITYKGLGWAYNADHMPGGLGFVGLDDPKTTETVTYKLQVCCQDTSYAFHLNRPSGNGNTAAIYHGTSMTSFILMEVFQ